MIFPAIELKFSQIHRTADATTLRVRLYRLDDGGVVNGQQQYVRTLKRDRTVSLPPDWTKAQILAVGRAKVEEWAIEEGYNLTADRLICSLS